MKFHSISIANFLKVSGLLVTLCSLIFIFEECKSESVFLSPSEKMQNKFQSFSTELWTKILTSVAEQENGQKMLEEIEGETLQEKAKKLNSEMMEKWGNAFVVSDVEAARLLSGKYDDNKNKIEVSNCISQFAKRGVPLPFIFRYLMQEFQTGKLNSGLLLEFTARLFKEHLKQISR